MVVVAVVVVVTVVGLDLHQLAAVDQLADSIPDELLDKFSDWVVCFEVDGEVQPLIEYSAKGYRMKEPWMYT